MWNKCKELNIDLTGSEDDLCYEVSHDMVGWDTVGWGCEEGTTKAKAAARGCDETTGWLSSIGHMAPILGLGEDEGGDWRWPKIRKLGCDLGDKDKTGGYATCWMT